MDATEEEEEDEGYTSFGSSFGTPNIKKRKFQLVQQKQPAKSMTESVAAAQEPLPKKVESVEVSNSSLLGDRRVVDSRDDDDVESVEMAPITPPQQQQQHKQPELLPLPSSSTQKPPMP